MIETIALKENCTYQNKIKTKTAKVIFSKTEGIILPLTPAPSPRYKPN